MKIRAYRETDWDSVREIYDLSKPDEMRGSVDLRAVRLLESDADMMALFRESEILVMEDGGEVVGFGGNKGRYISWLFVHPRYRRRGIGRALLGEILSRLPGAISLNVAAGNHAARALYEHFGFGMKREFSGTFNGHDCKVVTMSREQQG